MGVTKENHERLTTHVLTLSHSRIGLTGVTGCPAQT